MEILERLDWGNYVSPISDRDNPPFNWYGFKHRFGSKLIKEIFSMFNLSKGDSILDPFCGGGTTLIQSKIDGYNSTGLDISPFSVFISKALTTKYEESKINRLAEEISHKTNPRVEIPDVPLLQKSFSNDTLKYIFSLKDSINKIDEQEKDLFLLSLLSILNKVSKAKKSGGFLRITEQRRVPSEIVKNLFNSTINSYIKDFNRIQFSESTSTAFLGDSRQYPEEIKEKKFDAVLTSPPYPNRHDYTRIYQLELLVGFLNDNESIKKLRYNTLRSHVEARKRFEAEKYEAPDVLKNIISELGKKELNNPQIISTLNGYFEDMYLCLKEMGSVLKDNGYIGLVVSNVRYAGIGIPVDIILSEIGEQVGLTSESIHVLRYRGNSSQQMAEYKREPTRESLIVWKK